MNRARLRAPVLALLVACADWLFFRHTIGISLALFFALMIAAIVASTPTMERRRHLFIAMAVAVAAVLPLIEEVSFIASILAILALAHLALIVRAIEPLDVLQRAGRSCGVVFAEPFACCGNFVAWIVRYSRAGTARRVGNAAILWTVPAAFSAVFVLLFASANPVIDQWFAAVRLDRIFAALDVGRMFFWLAMAAFVSPFLFPRRRLALPPELVAEFKPDTASWPEWMRGDGAILRSLVVFNVLFAVQTALDLRYLWSGAALPPGLSFADYAHRGAYPLLATALLAGAFVIVAMKPGSAREHSPLLRALVFAWIAQNVLLVASSMLRLKLYVEVYSLTYWRCAAFIWMLLVALGLIWIVLRIVLTQSNRWLVSANVVTLGLALYCCGFVNFAAFVANYNVAHSRQMGGTGQPLDIEYLISLGPDAIPAIDLYLARADVMSGSLLVQRQQLADENQVEMADWRGWSLREERLAYYLRHHL